MATYTLSPFTKKQYFDDSGDPLSNGKIYTYASGTSSALTTYKTSSGTAWGAYVQLDSAGRPTNGEIYLQPGQSYKFIAFDSAGVQQWTQDGIGAVPPSAVNVDIPGTAGENLVAGDLCYIGASGSWFKADADAVASSTDVVLGFCVTDADSGATTTFRTDGQIELAGPLTAPNTYYVSATAGAITSTAPAFLRVVGQAQSSTTLAIALNPPVRPTINHYVDPKLKCVADGRLTLTSGTPYPTVDVTNGTTVYYTPAGIGNQIALYSASSVWVVRTFAELSIAVPASTNTNYDVFAYDNAGTVTLELSAAWNSATARHASGTYASTLPTQDGVWVKSTNGTTIDATRRYLGSFRTTGVSGQTSDGVKARFVYNAANQAERPMWAQDATATEGYTTTTWRQARGQTANKVEFVIGLAGNQTVPVTVRGHWSNTSGARPAVGVGIDSTTAPAAGSTTGMDDGDGTYAGGTATYNLFPGLGYHYAAWLEIGGSGAVFEYTNGSAVSGLVASIRQ